MRSIWIIGLAAVWCGCQGGEERAQPADRGAKPAAKVPAPPAVRDSRPVIACFGDSLTAGYGLDPGKSYPDVLQTLVDREGYRYRVANFGISGDTSQDGVERLPLVAAEGPEVVVLELGANDGLRGQPIAHTQANLARIIESLQQGGARVVLAGITLPPNYGPEYIRRFEAMYKELSEKYGTPLIPFLLAGVAGTERMQPDGLHPTAEGARVVAGTVWKSVAPLLKKG